MEQGFLLTERGRERFGRVLRLIGILGIDDNRQQVRVLRKRTVERRFLLAPGQIGIDELADIAVDGRVLRDIKAERDGEQKECRDETYRSATTSFDQPDNY